MLCYIKKKRLNKVCKNRNSYKIKILRIVSRLNIGGPSIHCSILFKGLNSKRFISKLVSGKISPHEGDMSYLVKSGRANPLIRVDEMQREIVFLKDLVSFFKIAWIIRKEKPDIVHTHLAKAGSISRIAVFVCNLFINKKIRTVHTFHGNVLEGYFSPLKSNIVIIIEKALAKITDAIIAISQTQKWELTEKFQLADANKVHIINLGFDLTRFLNTRRMGKLRSLLCVGDETLLIGIVGRLAPIKNHVLFMDSVKLLNERFPQKDIRFIIVGDGELRNYLEIYARKIGILEKVVFYGWEKEVEKIYADLDILVLTSNNEGTPVSIIESMASSVPVVTTGVGGIKDLLGRIETRARTEEDFSICERGILCSKGNAEAIASGIQYLIENDKHEILIRAREFVFKNYSDERLIERIEKLYHSLL